MLGLRDVKRRDLSIIHKNLDFFKSRRMKVPNLARCIAFQHAYVVIIGEKLAKCTSYVATKMNSFCPTCANMLLVEPEDCVLIYHCQGCPYKYRIGNKVTQKIPLSIKEIEDVLGGEEAWKNVQKTDGVPCSICNNTRAYFKEIQIRSADEPATVFFRCVSCGHQWKED